MFNHQKLNYYLEFKTQIQQTISEIWLNNQNPSVSAHLNQIQSILNREKLGNELWSAINDELKKMPSKWLVLNDSRSLKLALEKILSDFPREKLMQYDIVMLDRSNLALAERYESSLQELQNVQECFLHLKASVQNITEHGLEYIPKLEKENQYLKNQSQVLSYEKLELSQSIILLEKANQSLSDSYNKLQNMHNQFKADVMSRFFVLEQQLICSSSPTKDIKRFDVSNVNSARTLVNNRASYFNSTDYLEMTGKTKDNISLDS